MMTTIQQTCDENCIILRLYCVPFSKLNRPESSELDHNATARHRTPRSFEDPVLVSMLQSFVELSRFADFIDVLSV